MPRSMAAPLLTAILSLTTTSSAQSLSGGALLTRYVQGDRNLSWPAPFDTRGFLVSVGDAVSKGLPGSPELARRATAAFILEAAAARLDAGDIPGARSLVEWACARVRAHEAADDFDVAWHAAALSLAESFVDPPALEAHLQHSRAHVSADPLLALSWAVAAEQRTSPVLVPRLAPNVDPTLIAVTQKRIDAAVGRLMDDALDRFSVAAAHPATAPDARVRIARIRLALDQPEAALTVLAELETTTREGWTIYLARLFRGQALEQLGRPDEAIASFREALKVGPGGQTATMSLATLLYRRGRHDEAETLVQQLLAETDPISDPWWTYWGGSARLWTQRRSVMRGRLQ